MGFLAGAASSGGGGWSQQAGNSIGSLGTIAGAIIGRAKSEEDRNNRAHLIQQAYDQINAIGAPPDTANAILLEKFRSAGMLDPETEQTINAQFQSLAPEDTAPRAAQMQALQAFSQLSKTGMSPQDRLQLAQIQQRTDADNQARQRDIISNLQQRGQAGGGAELAARLSSANASNANAANNSLQVSAQGAQQRQAALQQLANVGGSVRSADEARNVQQANMANEYNRFNASNQIAQQQRNVAAKNTAQQLNLGNQQNIQNANTQAQNNELLRQKQAAVTDWNNQVGYGKLKSGNDAGLAGFYGGQAADTQGYYSGLGQGVGTFLGGAVKSAGAQSGSQKKSKDDEEEGGGSY